MAWAGIRAKHSRRSARARSYDVLEALVADVAAMARAGDHVLVMSNGGFGGVHQKLLDALGSVGAR